MLLVALKKMRGFVRLRGSKMIQEAIPTVEMIVVALCYVGFRKYVLKDWK